jgi:hypothetical protein
MLHDFGDGRGQIRSHHHVNPDGSLGGCVADDNHVDPTVYVTDDRNVDHKDVVFTLPTGDVITQSEIDRYPKDWSLKMIISDLHYSSVLKKRRIKAREIRPSRYAHLSGREATATCVCGSHNCIIEDCCNNCFHQCDM